MGHATFSLCAHCERAHFGPQQLCTRRRRVSVIPIRVYARPRIHISALDGIEILFTRASRDWRIDSAL